jgi:WS/DGAT/MGAT family acyltransferase
MSGFMRDSDAFAWYMESDPTLRSTVVAIAWLERAPEWDALVARIDQTTSMIPSFRQRVCVPPFRLATPRWTADATFDLSRHLHRVDASEVHTSPTVRLSGMDPVMAIAQAAATEGFDRSRPLWDFTLVEHLEGGRAAVVMKVHHSLTDGIGGIQLALLLFDREANPPPPPPIQPDDAIGANDVAGDLVVLSLARGGKRIVDLMSRATASMLPITRRVVLHPRGAVIDAVEATRSVGRTVAPINDTLSPVMRGRGVGRHLDVLEVQLPDLRRAAGAAGGTVNDGFMAAVTGGLRRYHERHAAPVDRLRVTLPISIRTPDDPIGGNRITLIRFAVAVAEADPASRIRELHRSCEAARDERSLRYTDAIAATLNLLPKQVVGGMLKHVDFVASNIPGFTFPVYLAGARVERNVAFGPTTGTAVNFTLLSHDGTCFVGINIDAAAVGDPEVLVECVREGFEEVLTLAGRHVRVRLPLRDVVPVREPVVSKPTKKRSRRASTPRSTPSRRPTRKERAWTA